MLLSIAMFHLENVQQTVLGLKGKNGTYLSDLLNTSGKEKAGNTAKLLY